MSVCAGLSRGTPTPIANKKCGLFRPRSGAFGVYGTHRRRLAGACSAQGWPQEQQLSGGAGGPPPAPLASSASASSSAGSPAAAVAAAAGLAALLAADPALAVVHAEPANALSLPTWAVHTSSVMEWAAAMGLIWKYAEVRRVCRCRTNSCSEPQPAAGSRTDPAPSSCRTLLPALRALPPFNPLACTRLPTVQVSGVQQWKGLTWGMLPCFFSAMCACTWHVSAGAAGAPLGRASCWGVRWGPLCLQAPRKGLRHEG